MKLKIIIFIVVVSAMAGETNRLIKLVESLTNNKTSEYDTVISSGEKLHLV